MSNSPAASDIKRRSAVPVTLSDGPHLFYLDFAGAERLEAAYDLKIADLDRICRGGAGAADLPKLAWACLLHEEPDITPEEVSRLTGELGALMLHNALVEATIHFLYGPKPREVEEETSTPSPRTTRKRTRTRTPAEPSSDGDGDTGSPKPE
jgi:hypothetical protein